MADGEAITLPHSENFRKVLGRLPTGVVVVTGGDPEHPSGLVCGSFMSVSLEPPLVVVSPAKTLEQLARDRGGRYVLRQRPRRRPGAPGTPLRPVRRRQVRGDRLASGPRDGAPLLDDVAAWIDCRIYQRVDAGDHLLVLGEVLELSVHRDAGALVFHRGGFHQLG